MPAASTRAERLRLKLEEEILSRRLHPGQKLDEEEIAVRFGLSRTPVREALKALSASGLVEIKPHQGSYVAALAPRTIIEMVETMAVLEISCAGMAAIRHTREDRTKIERAHEACESAASRRDPGIFYAANIGFHEAIYGASRNLFLGTQAQLLRQRLEPYRRQISYQPGSVTRANEQHSRIIAGIFSGDETGARDAMQLHLKGVETLIASMVEAIAAPPANLERQAAR